MDVLADGTLDAAANEGLESAFEGGGLIAPSLAPAVDEGNLAYEPQPLSFGRTLFYASGGFGNGTFVALNNYLQALLLIPLGASPILYGLLGSQRSFEGAILQPLIGAWSDRSRSRFGRRRVFILRFMPLCIFFTILTPFVPQLIGANSVLGIDSRLLPLVLVSISIFLFSVTYNISQDPYSALMADISPQRQRGVVNGIVQSVSFVGQISILLVFVFRGLPFTVLYPAVGVALLLFYIPTVFGIREPKKLPGANEHKRYGIRDYWNALRSDGQLQLYYAVQFFLWFGINSVVTFITLYAIDVVGLSKQAAVTLPIVLLVAIALGAWPLGALSGRLSLKAVFFLGLLCMAAASLTAIFLKDPLSLYIILAVAGVGYAATQATGYPLLTRLVYPEQMGLYTGLNSTVSSLAAPVSGLVAGALVGSLGYGVLFTIVGSSFALGLIPLLLLRVERSVVVRARAAAAAAAGLATA
jgi:Na+/melibiose symporter-like transporter